MENAIFNNLRISLGDIFLTILTIAVFYLTCVFIYKKIIDVKRLTKQQRRKRHKRNIELNASEHIYGAVLINSENDLEIGTYNLYICKNRVALDNELTNNTIYINFVDLKSVSTFKIEETERKYEPNDSKAMPKCFESGLLGTLIGTAMPIETRHVEKRNYMEIVYFDCYSHLKHIKFLIDCNEIANDVLINKLKQAELEGVKEI